MNYAVIMAGGVGSRFWPASRQARPKQFLSISGQRTLIQETVDRLHPLISPDRVLVVTHSRYVDATLEQLPELPAENVLAEPLSRNTAPCIAYAAAHLYARDKDATMVVLPADHLIAQPERFRAILQAAIDKAEEPECLVTIGVQPTHPETGYGYIQFDGVADGDQPAAHPVLTFAEKPDQATAERFVEAGDFLWNSGMFVWKAESILTAFARYLPDVYAAFKPFCSQPELSANQEAVEKAFVLSPKISIDYGVMERTDRAFVVPGSFGWSDVGDWRAVYTLREKNNLGHVFQGNVISQASSRCYVDAKEKLVALVGVHDLVVVETSDALLIAHRDSAQEVKHVVDYLNANGLDKYV